MSSRADGETRLQELHAAIINAHAVRDQADLARAYTEAAEHFDAEGDVDRAAFLFVHAYVWALDAADQVIASRAHHYLVQHGRER
jgi:hypothetical protein